jgi:hypothetical protein
MPVPIHRGLAAIEKCRIVDRSRMGKFMWIMIKEVNQQRTKNKLVI